MTFTTDKLKTGTKCASPVVTHMTGENYWNVTLYLPTLTVARDNRLGELDYLNMP